MKKIDYKKSQVHLKKKKKKQPIKLVNRVNLSYLSKLATILTLYKGKIKGSKLRS